MVPFFINIFIGFISYLTIWVPDFPIIEFFKWSGFVIMAFLPPFSRNHKIACILGSILPTSKWPCFKYFFVSCHSHWHLKLCRKPKYECSSTIFGPLATHFDPKFLSFRSNSTKVAPERVQNTQHVLFQCNVVAQAIWDQFWVVKWVYEATVDHFSEKCPPPCMVLSPPLYKNFAVANQMH